MLRLKKSLHPHVLADPDDADPVKDDQNVEDVELASPFGAMRGRSTRSLPISWPFPLRDQSFTSLMADLHQARYKQSFSFSRYISLKGLLR